MTTRGDAWIARIDKVRGVIDLTVYALWEGPADFRPEAQCALDLANEELQRLRDEIDEISSTLGEGDLPSGSGSPDNSGGPV